MFTKHLEISALVFLTQKVVGERDDRYFYSEMPLNPKHKPVYECPANYEKTDFLFTGWCHEYCAEGYKTIGTHCFKDCHTDGYMEDPHNLEVCHKPPATSRNPVWRWLWDPNPPGKDFCWWGSWTRCDSCTSPQVASGELC